MEGIVLYLAQEFQLSQPVVVAGAEAQLSPARLAKMVDLEAGAVLPVIQLVIVPMQVQETLEAMEEVHLSLKVLMEASDMTVT